MNFIKKILGTEPAVVSGAISAVIALAISFGLNWTQGQVGLVMALVTAVLGLYTAWVTTHTVLGGVVTVVNAAVALVVGFGANLTPNQAGAIIALVTVVVGAFQRTQTSPVPEVKAA